MRITLRTLILVVALVAIGDGQILMQALSSRIDTYCKWQV